MKEKAVKWLDIVNNTSTTNVRVFVTLFCTLVTMFAYVGNVINPSWDWLLFLIIMSGIDAAQYTSKRITYKPNTPSGETRQSKD